MLVLTLLFSTTKANPHFFSLPQERLREVLEENFAEVVSVSITQYCNDSLQILV